MAGDNVSDETYNYALKEDRKITCEIGEKKHLYEESEINTNENVKERKNSSQLSIQLISQNCNGLRNKLKRKMCFTWLKKQNADIALLQETHWSKEIENFVRNEWQGFVFFSHGMQNARGVAILIKKHCEFKIYSEYKDGNGRFLIIECNVQSKRIIIVNIYAPNIHAKREHFYRSLKDLLSQKFDLQDLQSQLVIAGDFNCVLNNKQDTFNVKSNYKTPYSLKTLMKRYQLIDIWRKIHSDKKQFTWRNKFLKIASRIDFVLLSKVLKNNVIKTDIRPVVCGDHNAVTVMIKVCGAKGGPGFWKFNTSLLKKDDYCEKVREIVRNVITEKDMFSISCKDAWELCKIRIREYSIDYTKKIKSKEVDADVKSLEKRLQQLNEKMWENDKEREKQIINEHEKITEELEKIYKSKCMGSIIRSRVKWFEEGEKTSKYFMSLEKRNIEKSSVVLLRNKKGKNITNQQNIRKQVHEFYSKLYNANTVKQDMDKYFCKTEYPKLTDDAAKSCEGLITEDECKQVISEFSKNKAPGSDGFGIEFFISFWPDIKDLLINSLNEGFQNKELSNTQRQAIIKLLHKKGDKTNLENWRPISLLNYDYKIAASVLSKRLQRVISTLISHDQVGYIKGRSLAENVRLIEDIFFYVQNYSFKGIAMLSDFRKAFDRLRWDFLHECLCRFGFQQEFRRWVFTLYSNIYSSVNVNGWLTEKINITRGVRQGCPLSALLFILAAEILAIKIRCDPEIKGITMFKTVEVKILQFADDATIFVEDCNSIPKVIKQIERFGSFSGLELNKEKCSLVNIKDFSVSANVEGISWCDSEVKILGVYFGKDNNKVNYMNWSPKINKIENLIKLWKTRKLTFFGKITIIKSFLVSQLIFNAQMISVPKDVMRKINSLLYFFLWNCKKDKVKRKVMCMGYEFGGLKMVDLDTLLRSFHMKWILIYFSSTDSIWKRVMDGYFRRVGSFEFILNCSSNKHDIMNYLKNVKIPPYYKDVLYYWFDLKELNNNVSKLNTQCNVKNEDIWLNSYIKNSDGQVLFFKKWFDAGIKKIHDILRNAEFLSLSEIEAFFEKKHASLFQEYNIVLNSIPKVWRRTRFEAPITKNQVEDRIVINQIFQNVHNKNKSKLFCRTISSHSNAKPSAENKWEERLRNNEKIEWKIVWKFNLKSLRENKIAEFNFKLLHDLIPHRYNLYKWKLCNNPICSFDNELHDSIHLFVNCKHTTMFWKRFNDVVATVYNIRFSFNEFILINGYDLKNKQLNSLNFLIIYAKYAIYKTFILAENRKAKFDELSMFSMFKKLVKNRLEVEQKCRDKTLCIFEKTLIQENIVLFV